MPTAGRIRVLGDHVINKIAAGEVIDRPAAVLKELMENALDAGATEIGVEVVAGGRTSIVVTDNGAGMTRDDALLSIERHATSKIHDVDDIEHIATLGFRGEALAAIAAVSRFALQTCPAETVGGTEIAISGGRLQEVREVGVPRGTRIAVRNLFFNVPARRKFLRTEQTELSHLRQVFLLYALGHPEAGLRLEVDGRETYRLHPGETLDERIRGLFRLSAPDALRRVSHGAGPMRLEGFAGVPAVSRSDRSDQYVFVNGRPAGAPLLHYALNEGYQRLLPRGRYPPVFLFLSLPPDEVDVNVHPTKKEVRFRHGGAVRDLVIDGLREALAGPARIPPGAEGPAAGAPPPEPPAPPEAVLPIADLPPARTFAYPRMSLTPPGESGRDAAAPAQASAPAGESPDTPPAAVAGSPWSWCRILGQVGGLFVVLETEDGMVLMDPHAAHERILYERFMREVLAHRVRGQGLLIPETVELEPGDAEKVRANLDVLREMGFGVSDFGGDSFIVDAAPALLGEFAVSDMLREAARSAERSGRRGGTEQWSEDLVAQAACKAAVKARDRLTLDEIERLVRDLADAEMPYTCPHGRPTLIFMSFNELRRKFGRQ